jgi:hypothetical protein
VQGNYKARKGIEVGSLSLHPQGIPHGPHPGTPEATIGATHTNELAVMCDTFAPLYPTTAALELDDLNYPRSWEHGWEPDAVESNGHANGKPSKSAKTAKTAKSGSKKLSRVVETKAASTAVSTSAKTGKATAGRSTSARAGKAANTWD